MAIIHQATLHPTKLELLAAWLPSQPWYRGDQVQKLGSYRFDDPTGDVGLEAFLIDTGTDLAHVPLSYRGAPLDGAEDFLIGTMEHSVLGKRYVYDAVGDPVWANALMSAILAGGKEAAEEVTGADGSVVVRPSTTQVRGSGDGSRSAPTLARVEPHTEAGLVSVAVDGLKLIMVRTIGTVVDSDAILTGRWDGADEVVLAGVWLDE